MKYERGEKLAREAKFRKVRPDYYGKLYKKLGEKFSVDDNPYMWNESRDIESKFFILFAKF